MNNTKKNLECQITLHFSVYAICCRTTNQFYAGVTYQDVYKRIRQHKRGKKQFIDSEIRRIGWEGNWDWWIVEENIHANLISEREKVLGSLLRLRLPQRLQQNVWRYRKNYYL